ncbi:chloride channel protein [Paracoccus rhizosphaerae]|uniref:Chloride channel protein n=1 Tax=Paracoccus rhizosphaerae TaxID=1133347 RepID=A0ABV6CP56_9RHOB|nr:chloride channel protein [Paracoccus rhizosphaerae]
MGGGRIAGLGSLYITAQTILFSGFGGSVGIEAAYTQAASSGASWLGQRLRREDLRQLVAPGAGGAIAVTVDAQLAGAFYAFELALATYTVASLLPVLAASMAAIAVARLISDGHGPSLYFAGHIPMEGYLPVALLAVLAAVGIAIMRSVTLMEQLFGQSAIPGWMQPMIGDLAVGILALISPQVLSSGHGAMNVVLGTNMTVLPC